jgi:hypothetical protein
MPLFGLFDTLGQQNASYAGWTLLQRFVLLQKFRKMAVVATSIFRGIYLGDVIFQLLGQSVLQLSAALAVCQHLRSPSSTYRFSSRIICHSLSLKLGVVTDFIEL